MEDTDKFQVLLDAVNALLSSWLDGCEQFSSSDDQMIALHCAARDLDDFDRHSMEESK